MHRIVVLGRGGSGKSTLAHRLGRCFDLPVIELDKLFWGPHLSHPDKDEWAAMQRDLAAGERWIMDGDLGPYDEISARLPFADTVILLDFAVGICAKRAFNRSRERFDFWIWLILWRWRDLKRIRDAVQADAPLSKLVVLRNQLEVDRFVESL